MMKQEFEKMAGYEVSIDDYNNIIEPMYMATNLSKEEFVKCIDLKRFALKPLKTIVREMKKLAEQVKDTCTHYTDYETRDKIEALAKEYINRKYQGTASYGIHEEMLWTCYYPQSIEIYSRKTWQTLESITLI